MARELERMIVELCREEDIDCRAFAGGWVFELRRGASSGRILGYQFDLNTAASAAICTDKSAASELLTAHGIPNVEHRLFFAPEDPLSGEGAGCLPDLFARLGRHGTLVCKPNEGSGGVDVFRVGTPVELERTARHIWRTSRAMAVSPYEQVAAEYRVVTLGGAALLLYEKRLPAEAAGGEALFWKHNLAQGASPVPVEDGALRTSIVKLAQSAAAAVGLTFGSVDIIATPEGQKILELNSGVMMEHFARSSPQNAAKAKEVYRAAVRALLAAERKNAVGN